MKTFPGFLLAVFSALVPAARGQSTISAIDHSAYAANAGWIDFMPSLANGVSVTDTWLAGYAYAANFGWVFFGDGSPDNGHTYSNASATDCGVNVALDGKLTGYAYGANIGWINFEQVRGQPYLGLPKGIFGGSAYSANLGWISLSTSFSNLATLSISRPDTDNDGIADGWEMYYFGNLTTANATSDGDGDGSFDLTEYRAGTLPQDPASSLRIVSHVYSNGYTQADITFTSVATRYYRLEYDEDLVAPWTNSAFGTFLAAGATTTKSLDGLSAVPRRFFRAVAIGLPTAP